MSVLESDTKVVEVSRTDNSAVFTGMIDTGWSISGNPNGGYLLSLVTSAIRKMVAHPDPLSMTTHFLRPGTPGEPCEITVDIIRTGRSLTTLRAVLTQSGKDRLVCLGAYGDLATSQGTDSNITMPMPDMPPPDACVERTGDIQGIDLGLTDKLDVMLHPGQARPGQAGIPEVSGWIRLKDGQVPDTHSLLLFCDTFPPSPLGQLGLVGWVPTIELTTHVRRRPAPGWILARFRTDDLHEGRMIESGALWDSQGQLVATCRQLGLVMQGG